MRTHEEATATPLSERFVDLWMRELCAREPKEGPATIRRWYLALTRDRDDRACNDNGRSALDAAAAARLVDLCRTCKNRCKTPLA